MWPMNCALERELMNYGAIHTKFTNYDNLIRVLQTNLSIESSYKESEVGKRESHVHRCSVTTTASLFNYAAVNPLLPLQFSLSTNQLSLSHFLIVWPAPLSRMELLAVNSWRWER